MPITVLSWRVTWTWRGRWIQLCHHSSSIDDGLSISSHLDIVWSEEYREPESASGRLPSLPASAPSAGLCVCDDDCPFRCPFLAKLVGLRVGGLELLVVEDFQ